MADKNKVNRSIKKLQRVKTWQLVILLVIMLVVSLTLLRLNNIGMVERRSAVATADETGDEEVIINRLYDLQRYVTSHMNTDMGTGIYLQSSYDRAVKAAHAKAIKDENAHVNINKKADEVCKPRFSSYSTAYLQCFLGELEKYPGSDSLKQSLHLPDRYIYLHSFASPLWSPDFAGWSLLVCALIALVIVVRGVSLLALRVMLNSHYKSI